MCSKKPQIQPTNQPTNQPLSTKDIVNLYLDKLYGPQWE